MQIIIDIDGTICTEEKTYSRSLARPLKDAVSSVNALYDEGHTIIFYTARTWMEFEMTTDWLKKNGFISSIGNGETYWRCMDRR